MIDLDFERNSQVMTVHFSLQVVADLYMKTD